MVKRKALLIVASGGNLGGVKLDVNGYKRYLMSDMGGAWDENEIKILYNQSRDTILTWVALTKEEKNDFVFSVFTGHGAYSIKHDERFVCDNDDKNIFESELLGLSAKQVLILDSCAHDYTFEEFTETSETKAMLNNASVSIRQYYRKKYDEEISKCPPQNIKLYSCSRNQSSQDEEERGGLYSYNLLKVLKESNKIRLDFITAHQKAKEIVHSISFGTQTPVAAYPKLPAHQILPASIKLQTLIN